MSGIIGLIAISLIILVFYVIHLIAETNRITKQNHEKLDVILKLLQKEDTDELNTIDKTDI